MIVFPKKKLDKLKEYCEEYNLPLSVVPTPKLGNAHKPLDNDAAGPETKQASTPQAIEPPEPSPSMQM